MDRIAAAPLFFLEQVLQRYPPTFSPDMVARDAIAAMHQVRSGCGLVTRGRQLVGIVTDREIVGALLNGMDLATLPVSDLMSHQFVTITEAEAGNVTELWQRFQQYQLSYLPVVTSGDALVGIIYLTDLVQVFNPLEAWDTIASLEYTLETQTTQLRQERVNHQQTEIALGQSEQKFQMIFRASSDPILIQSLEDGTCLDINDQFAALVGYSREELVGRTALELGLWSNPQDWNQLQQLLQQSGQVRDLQIDIRIKTGAIRTGLLSADVIELAGQRWVVAIVKDITQCKQAELSLWESQQLLHSVLTSAPVSIFLKNLDGQYLLCNGVTEEYAVLPEGHILGHTDYEVRSREIAQQFYEFDQEVIKTQRAIQREETVAFPGEVRTYITTKFPIYCPNKSLQGIGGVSLDITARKQLELALQASEARLSATLNGVRAAILKIRVFGFWNHTIDYISEGCEVLFGYTAEELQQDESLWSSNVLVENLKALFIPVFENILAENPITIEYPFRHKNGAIRWISSTYSSQRDSNEKCWLTTLVSVDITERKRLETALQNSEEKLNYILNTANAAIISFQVLENFHRKNLFFSAGCEIVFGYSAEEFMEDENLWDLRVFPEDWQTVILPAVRTIISAGKTATLEYRFYRKDGSLCWISDTLTSQLNHLESCWEVTSVATDITPRKELELALEQEAYRRKILFDTSIDGIVITDLRGNVVDVNPKFARMLGYSLQEIAGLNVTDWDIQWTREEIQQKLADFELANQTFETCHRRKDGSTYNVEISSALVSWNGEVVNFCICRDITDRKQTETRLRKTEEWLRQYSHQSPSAIYTIVEEADGTAYFEYLSEAAEAIHEIPLEKILEDVDWVYQQFHPDDLEGYVAAVNHSAQMLENFSHEWRIITPSGKVKWLKANSQPERCGNGAMSWHGVIEDITDRKKTEIALQQSETAKNTILSIFPDLLIRHNQDGVYLEVYKGRDFKLYKPNVSLPGESILNILPQSLAQEIRASIQQSLETGEMQTLEYQLQLDGELQYEESRILAISENEVLRIARNVTDRKKLEFALQAAEAKLRDVLDSAIAAITSFRVFESQQFEYDYYSEGALVVFGYTPHELAHYKYLWRSRIFPEDLETVILPAWKNICAGGSTAIEYRFYHKNGNLRWISSSYSVRRDETANCWVVTAVSTDITDRKLAEELLNQTNQEMQAIFATFPDLFFRLASDGTILDYRTRNVADLYTSPENFLGKKFQEVLPASVGATVMGALRQTLQTGDVVSVEYSLPFPQGEQYFEARVILFQEDQAIAIARNITDRKQAEAALQESEAKNRALISALPDLLMRVSREGMYLDFIATKTFNVVGETGDFIGTYVHESLPFELAERRMAAVRRALETREIQIYEHDMEVEGQIQTEEVRVVAFGDNEALLVVRDISDRKRAEEQLKNSLREKEVLLSEVHHRVKNNLQIVSSLLDLQIMKLTDDQTQIVMASIRDRVNSMALVHENLYRTQNFAAIRFADYIEQLGTHLFQAYVPLGRNIHIAFSLDLQVTVALKDAVPCGLLLNELITNALKHGFPGESSGNLYIELGLQDRKMLCLTVGHDGDTLPPDFELSHRINSMGLKLVLLLTEQLGGTIRFDRGAKTVFTIVFPHRAETQDWHLS